MLLAGKLLFELSSTYMFRVVKLRKYIYLEGFLYLFINSAIQNLEGNLHPIPA